MKKIILTIFISSISLYCFSQQDNKVDSLVSLMENTKIDSSKLRLLNELAWMIRFKDSEAAKKYCEEALQIALKIKNKEEESRAYAIMGNLEKNKGEMQNALDFYEKARVIREKLGNKKLIAEINNHIGIVYVIQTDYPKTLEHWKKALEMYREIDNKQGIASILGNIGIVYDNLGDYNTSLNYYLEALKIHEQLPDNESAISAGLNNIGLIYANIKNYELSLEYHKKALKIREKIQDLNGLGDSYINLGDVYKYLNKLDSAEYYIAKSITTKKQIGQKAGIALALLQYGDVLSKLEQFKKAKENLNECLTLYTEFGDLFGKALTLQALGIAEMRLNNYGEAQKHYFESLNLFTQIGAKSHIGLSYMNISENEYMMGNYKNAYLKLKRYALLKDTLINDESTKQIAQMQTIYESEKKQLEIENLNQKNNLNQLFIKQQTKEKYLLIIGLILVVSLAIFVYNRLQITRKQKKVIEEQHKEIQDSINYAKRIQTALLTADEYWNQISSEHFVYFKPRDVVSGDFFWAYHTDNNIAIWVAADCTGHGVPGAFMSMLGVGFLNEIVAEGNETKANEILNKLRNKIIKSLEQKGVNTEQKDGMDIALCVWNKQSNKLQYAGAYNPLYLIRNGELIEHKADKQPIGKFSEENKPFTNKEIDLQKGDTLYVFSDGYIDQFGGSEGKKFMSKNFKNLLISIQNMSMEQQKEHLNTTFEKWMNEGETSQIDDVCVVGVRV